MPPAHHVAIIGAGLSGLTAGRTLAEHGLAVSVFDKGRGPGGRMSTRRHGDYRFDHGAQYFTVRDRRFARAVEAWAEAGVVQPWTGRIAVAEGSDVTLKDEGPERWVGVPGMNAVPKHLADALDVRYTVRIARVDREGGLWRLVDETGSELGPFGAVLITTPPSQAVPLLAAAPALARQADAVGMHPTWAVMATFDAPLPLDADGLFIHGASPSWAARNSDKPGRPAPESWVIHGAIPWSEDHLDDAPEAVENALLTGFFSATGLDPVEPAFVQAHRWRYAQAGSPLEAGCLWDESLRLGACGDWCHGSRVEGAFLSGLAAAQRVLAS